MIYCGKIGTAGFAPTTVTLKTSSLAANKGALVELTAGVITLWDGTGDIIGITEEPIVSADTDALVTLISQGDLVLADVEKELEAIGGGANSFTVAFGGGLATGALVGMKVLVTKCAATASAVGKVFKVTASDMVSGGETTLTLSGSVSPTFASGDTIEIYNLEGARNTLIGVTGVELNSTKDLVTFTSDWGQSDLTIVDIKREKMVLAVVNTVF